MRLRRYQRRVRKRDEQIEGLKQRVAELEAAGEPRLDLNEATFEELRELGLNVTQSSRLIAYRDTSHGLGSVDELEALPGFGKATLKLLRSRAHVNGS